MKCVRPSQVCHSGFVSLWVLLFVASIQASEFSEVTQGGQVTEFALRWPSTATGSTHELTYDPSGEAAFWVTGQNHDHVARVDMNGKATFFAMPEGSRPHGIVFDRKGHLWVSLEFISQVVRLDREGRIRETIDVALHAKGAAVPLNTNPHGLGLDSDGETLWFTGKKSNTVGKINPDRSVEHFELPTVGAVPIYLAAGPDGNMWGTELVGNAILRVTPEGKVTEFPIPTYNSRPIAIVPGPDGQSMWFSEEAGRKVGRIDMIGNITEYPIPLPQKNLILAGMAFDDAGHLWTHSYVDAHAPSPSGPDYIIRIGSEILSETSGDISGLPVVSYAVPTRNTLMHRITQGPDGSIWFTELGADKLGRLAIKDGK